MVSQSLRPLNTTPAGKGRLRWLALLLILCYALFPIYWLTNNLALLTSDRFAAGLADLLLVSSGVAVLTLLIGAAAARRVRVRVKRPLDHRVAADEQEVAAMLALCPLAQPALVLR